MAREWKIRVFEQKVKLLHCETNEITDKNFLQSLLKNELIIIINNDLPKLCNKIYWSKNPVLDLYKNQSKFKKLKSLIIHNRILTKNIYIINQYLLKHNKV